MNLPQFTAQASLYRTSNRYRSSVAEFGGSIPAQSVVAALTFEDTVNCETCENRCNDNYATCIGYASAAWGLGLLGCALLGPFSPLCAGPVTTAYALASGLCVAGVSACHLVCNSPGGSCCPVFCELGHCCSHGETCIPHGCCPNERIVCNGTCCAEGETCCGNTCCPQNYYCLDGDFCSQYPSNVPFGNPSPPMMPPTDVGTFGEKKKCPPGYERCGKGCCPPGLQCCNYSAQFGPDCKTSCLH
jgi:hypothetical protein